MDLSGLLMIILWNHWQDISSSLMVTKRNWASNLKEFQLYMLWSLWSQVKMTKLLKSLIFMSMALLLKPLLLNLTKLDMQFNQKMLRYNFWELNSKVKARLAISNFSPLLLTQNLIWLYWIAMIKESCKA